MFLKRLFFFCTFLCEKNQSEIGGVNEVERRRKEKRAKTSQGIEEGVLGGVESVARPGGGGRRTNKFSIRHRQRILIREKRRGLKKKKK